MRIHSMVINDFRGIKEIKFLFSNRINVFLGINGAGKSAVLDAMAILLSRLVARITGLGKGRTPHENDIKNDADFTSFDGMATIFDEFVAWSVRKQRQGIRRQNKGRMPVSLEAPNDLGDVGELIRKALGEKEALDLPIITYYPVNRAILDIPLRIRKKHPDLQLATYENALTGRGSEFRIFFEWFRNREDLENEKRIDDSNHRDSQLEAVRRAIAEMMPGFDHLRVRRSPLRMTLTKDGHELLVNQLSDGEKCFLALTGDLARRLALANVNRVDPLKGAGVVLIDEIDLHLHPSWQRRVIPGLLRTFPNCQFIVSTHSAQVISHIKPESIWMLHKDHSGEIVLKKPARSLGMDSNSILEEIMESTERPEFVQAALAEIFLQIQEGNIERAEQEIGVLMEKIGQDPELARADAMIRRKQLIGR